jgi:hypothetical protein
MSNKTFSQNFDALTSQIFFNIDIKKLDTAIISDLKSRKELILKEDTGWTVYPPTYKDGSPIPFFRFSFSSNPYFSSNFKNGGLMIMISDDSKKIVGMSLSVSFESKDLFDSTYNNLQKLYNKYSSKAIKRPNIGKPFEMTKFLSKGNSDFVILTKGEDDNKPYIHISYNFQGYDW